MALSDKEVRRRVEAVEALLARVEGLPEECRAVARDTVQVLLELYGEAFRRILSAPDRDALLAQALHDELLSHLFILHDLHPDIELVERDGRAELASRSQSFVPVEALLSKAVAREAR